MNTRHQGNIVNVRIIRLNSQAQAYCGLRAVNATRRMRQGLSIPEVLFAIGILLIGILGLASVIPIGVSQSSDAIETDKSLMTVQNLVAETVARVASGTESGFVAPSVSSALPQSYSTLAATPAQLRRGLCVDPWFLTAAENRRPGLPATFDQVTGYDRTQFPCYDQGYNPLVAPSASGVFTAAGLQNSGWFNALIPPGPPPGGRTRGPRLARVAASHDGYSYTPASSPLLNRQVPIAPAHSHEFARSFQSPDPALFLPKDSTRPPGRIFRATVAPLTLVRPLSTGRYSSFALVQSDARDHSQVNISTVVLDRRSAVINPGAFDYLDPSAPAVGEARFDLRGYTFDYNERPYYEGEQLLFVSAVPNPASFAAGLGGRVTVVTHHAVTTPPARAQDPPGFKRDQYILLMRQVYPPAVVDRGFAEAVNAEDVPPIPERVAYAWFKIRDVVTEPFATTFNDPVGGTTRDVWAAELELRGPAWIFDDAFRGTAAPGTIDFTTVPDNTFAVFMPDVVAVLDRTITVQID